MAFYPGCNVVLDVLLEDFAGGSSGEILTIITTPRSFEWTNDHRSADSFTMELDYMNPHRTPTNESLMDGPRLPGVEPPLI